MPLQDVPQLTFGFLPALPIVVQPSAGQITSDAGLLPLAQADARLRYTQRLAAGLTDGRQDPEHTLLEMLRQRLYGLLADYEDCNDHDRLRDDPLFQLVAGRVPDDGPRARQPTLARFENGVDPFALERRVEFLTVTGVERLRHKHGGQLPAQLTLDLDATDDETHGQQQLTFFHGYYDQWPYFPLVVSEPSTKHVFHPWLRPGAVHAAHAADESLEAVGAALRAARPDVQIHIRGDSGFGVPWMYAVCERNGWTYTFGIATNERLKVAAQPLLDEAVRRYAETGEKQRLFMYFADQAQSGAHPRTVIAKAECQAAGTNLRFVVTNLPVSSVAQAQARYDDYVQRGTSEQRLDEFKNGLHADRRSCHRFCAHFWRLVRHAAAYNLLNWVRDAPQVPAELRAAQPATWRSKVIKVAATVVQSTRRVLVQLAAQWPFWDHYWRVGKRSLQIQPAGP